MQIGSISSLAATDAILAAPTAGASSTKAHAEASAAGASTETAATSSSSTSAAPSQGGVMSPEQEALAAIYTTSVAGHDYLGTVQQAAGEYVVSVADPPAPPITGIGSSIESAENNLTVTIDERV